MLLLIHASRSEVLLQFLSQEGELEVIVILSKGEVLESLWEAVVVVKGQVFEGVWIFYLDEKLIVNGQL
jgi:hypothetical protein